VAPVGVAVAGCGEWGRNHVRAVAALAGARLLHVADPDAARREIAQGIAPGALVTESLDAALRDPKVSVVAIASPGPTHVPLARLALAAGKHVLVEKPLAPSPEEAEDLVARAKRAGRVLGVGHLLLYHPAVRHLRGLIARGALGEVHYLYAQRTNLGRIRSDESALWSLGPHDLSVMAHLLDAWPASVSAQGAAYVQPSREDVVFLTLRFPGNRLAHIHLSWLDPHKVRRLTIVGSSKMAVFDDMEPAEKIRLHDKGAAPVEPGTWGEALSLRFGETRIPRLSPAEPLREEWRAFLRSVRTGAPLLADAASGLAVVRVLAAAEASLRAGGRETAVGRSPRR
jgi:predicted dehydrogenase